MKGFDNFNTKIYSQDYVDRLTQQWGELKQERDHLVQERATLKRERNELEAMMDERQLIKDEYDDKYIVLGKSEMDNGLKI